ncbi:hypothetical protein IG631_22820 [Alternaria alternata]|nr:hypothetical protein IG631_22820 [Alternaria alternata]
MAPRSGLRPTESQDLNNIGAPKLIEPQPLGFHHGSPRLTMGDNTLLRCRRGARVRDDEADSSAALLQGPCTWTVSIANCYRGDTDDPCSPSRLTVFSLVISNC